MRHRLLICILSLALPIILTVASCSFDKTPLKEITQNNGNNGGGGGDDEDTTDTGGDGIPCDPDSVYFETDILPILISNCAKSGCHDDASHKEGIILTSYQKVMQTAEVKPYNLSGGKLYEVITESQPDNRMPPPPNSPLSYDDITLIAKWIMQGAKDLHCNQNMGDCDLSNVTYSQTISTIMATYCTGCHGGGAPSGGILLNNYSSVAEMALNGRLVGAITYANGYSPMPKGGNMLPVCEIDQITTWVDAGAPNN